MQYHVWKQGRPRLGLRPASAVIERGLESDHAQRNYHAVQCVLVVLVRPAHRHLSGGEEYQRQSRGAGGDRRRGRLHADRRLPHLDALRGGLTGTSRAAAPRSRQRCRNRWARFMAVCWTMGLPSRCMASPARLFPPPPPPPPPAAPPSSPDSSPP